MLRLGRLVFRSEDPGPWSRSPQFASTPALLQPLTVRGLTLRHRLVVAPMCQYSVTDGLVGDYHLVHLGRFALGGFGLVIVEATGVTADGRISLGDVGLWSDEHIPGLARIADFLHAEGAAAGIQLSHAGSKASSRRPWDGGGPVTSENARPGEAPWPTASASAVPVGPDWPVPHELTVDELAELRDAFVAATRRSLTAGFDVIELHAAHGYLLHQFLSPLSNHRTDGYGGSLENRMRLLLEVTTAIRSLMPEELPLFVRISATDWAEGGWDVEQSVVLARRLQEIGVDLIDVSSGGSVPGVRIPVGPGYQVPFARRIRHEAGIRTGAVGLITEPRQAEEILENGDADLIILARELLRNPYWAQKAQRELGRPVEMPVQYERAR